MTVGEDFYVKKLLTSITFMKYQGAIIIPSFQYPEINLPSRRRIRGKIDFHCSYLHTLMTSNQVQNVISFPQGHQLVYACYVAASGIKVLRENSILLETYTGCSKRRDKLK